ncbi:MAG: alpha/beta hydrolase [Pseudomonadota bacterium]
MTLRKRFCALVGVPLAVLLTAFFPATHAGAQPVASHKDRLFSYPALIETRDGGQYRIVDYREARDIDRRDEVPERRVKRAYVDGEARRATKTLNLDTSSGPLTARYVGSLAGARMVTIYIHGSGGNSKQGVNDFSFGGNFNRIKALMLKSGGAYIAPDAGSFEGADKARLAALSERIASSSPAARFVLACGSSGAAICYHFADDASLIPRLAGFILLGGYPDDSYRSSRAGRARVPLMIAHGSRDTVFDVGRLETFYAALRKSGIPTMMVRFETGTHGTPIRMIDWRDTLNWILTN